MYTRVFFFLVSQKTEVKRNVQKFHVLTFWKEKIVRKHHYLKENDFLNLYLGIRGFLFLPSTFPKDGLLFLYTSAFWLFSSTFSSSFFSSSEEPLSFSPVFQLPCLFRIKHFFFLPDMLTPFFYCYLYKNKLYLISDNM